MTTPEEDRALTIYADARGALAQIEAAARALYSGAANGNPIPEGWRWDDHGPVAHQYWLDQARAALAAAAQVRPTFPRPAPNEWPSTAIASGNVPGPTPLRESVVDALARRSQPAPRTVTAEVRDRIAEAIYLSPEDDRSWTWAEMPEKVRDWWRLYADAALEVLTITVEPTP
jgi:hypothetical protein